MLKQIGYALLCTSAFISTSLYSATPLLQSKGYIIVYPKHSETPFTNFSLDNQCGICTISMEQGITTNLRSTVTNPTIYLNNEVVPEGTPKLVPVQNGSSFDLRATPFAGFTLSNDSDYDITSDCTAYECPSDMK